MPERDAPIDIDELPNIQAENRQKDASVDNYDQAGLSMKADGASTSARVVKRQARTLSAMWPAIAVLILCIIGLSIWNKDLVERQHQQQDSLFDAKERIVALESKLSSTDESMTQSSVVMQIRLKDIEKRSAELWTQMDKLWASAWRRNQTEISDHTKQLSVMDKSFAANENKVEKINDNLTSALKAISDLKAESADLAKNIKVFTAKTKEIATLKAQLQDQIEKNRVLQKSVDDNSQWQKSNNAFRIQTNKTLERLELQIKAATAVEPKA